MSQERIESAEILRDGKTFAVRRGFYGPARRPVILKAPGERAPMIDALARLNNEHRVARDLSHPALTQSIDFVQTTDGPVLVFPDDGLTSLDRMDARPLRSKYLLAVATAVAGAISELHGRGIVHRDVKPSNVVASMDFKTVKLIDYCLAAPVEALEAEAPGSFAALGTAAYMAPEQTGRANLAVDHRADLYGLGVTLYELATGERPFTASDPTTLLHQHMTAEPRPPHDVVPTVPPVLSAAIMRLLEKNPDDRFQTADELLAALSAGEIQRPVELAPFRVPETLFGRSRVAEKLAADVSKGMNGPCRLFRVAGASGIGKSHLVRQCLASAVEAGAICIQGKFEQSERARPYEAMVQAANMLLTRILTHDDEIVGAWRDRIAEAISPNGGVLLDLLPQFEALIGAQPPIADLGLNEARIRVSVVLRRFFRAIASSTEPIVVFIDDMHWADQASCDLIRLIMTDPEIRDISFLCAYRDNEIGRGHPAADMFRDLRQSPGVPDEVLLIHLDDDAISAFVAETVGRTPCEVSDLADMIGAKTAGNPFAIRQFLYALHRKGFIHAASDGASWTWDSDAIRAEGLTDDVAHLVTERLLDLPEATLELLELAACLGTVVDTDLVARVSDLSIEETSQLLAPALERDLLLEVPEEHGPQSSRQYRFQHDRILQAVKERQSAEKFAERNALIGALLLKELGAAERESRLAEITDYLIIGRMHLGDDLLSALRTMAIESSRRSKRSNAWDAALRFLDAAEETLGADGWTADLELTFTLTLERAEAAYLKGDAPLAAQICDELLARNLDALKQVRVLEMIILLHTSQLAYRDALQAGVQALALLQESLPISPGPVKLLSELARCRFALRRHDQESLLALPAMTDPMRLAVVRVLGLMAAPAYFTETYLLPLIGLRIVHHSIQAGNSVHSPYGYAIYGMLHCAVLGRPKQGLVYGDLAIRCVEKYNAAEIEGRVLMLYAGFIQHWTKPLAETLPVFMEGARKAIAAGDLEYHGYTRYGHASFALMAGQSLPNVAQLLEGHQAAVTTHTHEKTHRIMQMAKASIARMRGLPADQVPDFDEDASFALWTKQQDATSLAYLHKYRMLEAVQRGDTDGVLSAAKGMRANMNGILSMAYQPFFQFYEALAIAEKGRRFAGPGRLGHIARVAILLRRLCHWSDDAPVTLDHRVHLVKAELHALRGQVVKAIARFEKAIDVARRAGALHDVGVCLERTGLFYHWLGTREAAERYLSEAVRAYRNWGADAWAEALQARHPELIRPEEETVEPASVDASIGSSSSGTGQIVDSSTLIRAAAALARKTSLPEVIDEVMRAMVVNAGARRGLLLLKDGDELTAVAEALHDGAVRTMQTPASAYADMPGGLINYVRHAAQTVVLDSARLDPNFGEDPYFQNIPTASVMCVPIMAMGELTAIVYLENSRLRGAFTPARRRTISVLGAQAAVSVENARLIDDLRSSLERQVELTSAHARFVPHSFLEKMERPSIADVRLGDHVQSEASILFSDIRGFTGLIESMAPEEAIAFINAYLSRMEPAVQRGSGFVDSYVGDAVMAVFDLGADVAVTAGLEMNRTLKDWADSGNLPSDAPIRIGIGIASGPIMFGTIGGANRLKCGVIGDAVNLASRIEGLTKRYKATMLINQTTFEQLSSPERHQIRKIDTVRVSGRSAEVNLYEVFDDDPLPLREQKRRSAPEITSGLSQLQSGAVGPAFEIFRQCRMANPDDPVPGILEDRCREILEKRKAIGETPRHSA